MTLTLLQYRTEESPVIDLTSDDGLGCFRGLVNVSPLCVMFWLAVYGVYRLVMG